MTEEQKAFILERINTCPFNRAQGFSASIPEEGRAIVEVDVKEQHRNIWGLPHGGILFALADVASGLATHSVCAGHTVTASSNVNFIFANENATHLKAESKVIKQGHALAVVQAEVYDNEGNHLLTGQFNMFHS